MTPPAVSVVMACTAVADDNGMRALRDVATAADGIEYLVIGGHMVRLLRHVYNVPGGIPRVTSDADTGISVDVATTGGLHDRLTALGYEDQCGNRYERGEQAVDLLVPAAAKPGKQIIGERHSTGGRQGCASRWHCRRSRWRSPRGSPTATRLSSKPPRFPTSKPPSS